MNHRGQTMKTKIVRPIASAETLAGQWLRELRAAVAVRDLRATCRGRR